MTPTLPVTVKISLTTPCRATWRNCLLLSDLPFYGLLLERAFENAAIVMMRAGANMVKIEGGALAAWLIR